MNGYGIRFLLLTCYLDAGLQTNMYKKLRLVAVCLAMAMGVGLIGQLWVVSLDILSLLKRREVSCFFGRPRTNGLSASQPRFECHHLLTFVTGSPADIG